MNSRESTTHPHSRRSVYRAACAAVVSLFVLGSAVGCSGQSSGTSDSAAPGTTSAPAVDVEDAGSGEVQRVGDSTGLGTRNNPVTADYVEEEIGHEGERFMGAKTVNLCASLDPSVARHAFTRFGVSAAYYDIAYGNGTATLVCSAPQGAIWPLTTGPGYDGVSVPCPDHKPRAVANVGVFYFAYTDDGTRASWVFMDAGGKGYNNDGMWNYKFHNWNTRDVTPTLWLLCE